MRPVAAIGVMPMPEDFKYAGVFRKGKPQHDFYDTFRIRHPKMAAGKRAKIFAPFDALTGFSEAICAKDIVYTDRIEPDEAHLAELNRRLAILHGLTRNGRLARQNRVTVDVTYYAPCTDENSEARGIRGQYRTLRGICERVDREIGQTVRVDGTSIAFADILRIERPAGIFDPTEGGGTDVHTVLYRAGVG